VEKLGFFYRLLELKKLQIQCFNNSAVELINAAFKCAMQAACSNFNGILPNFLSLLRTSWQL
jgi:hypothetical protein